MTQSLNLQYLLLLLYNAATGVNYTEAPAFFSGVFGALQGLGIFFSLLFLAGLVYLHLRYAQLHHEHDHSLEAHQGQHDTHEAAGASDHHSRWEQVMTMMTQGHQSSWRAAIVEADILLSELLTDLRLPGESIGEQLKAVSRSQFTTLDLAWEAHKVRNEIAHQGSTFELTDREARRTIDLYRQVFEEFNYI